MRRGDPSSPPASRARHSLMSVREICGKKSNFVALKESVAITLSTNVDLDAIESLGVRVATIVVKNDEEEVCDQ